MGQSALCFVALVIAFEHQRNQMTMMTNINNASGVGPFGDTTLTKVFVRGLAWETPKEAMRDHFHKYGEILEAVIISHKTTGRSKGYQVTFKEPEAAKKACEDPTPVINRLRANCNLASLGARRHRSVTIVPPQPAQQQPQTGPKMIVGLRSIGTMTPPPNHVQWYYPPTPTPSSHTTITRRPFLIKAMLRRHISL